MGFEPRQTKYSAFNMGDIYYMGDVITENHHFLVARIQGEIVYA